MPKRSRFLSICIFGSFVLLRNIVNSMTREFLENTPLSSTDTKKRLLTDSANHIDPGVDKTTHPWHSSPEIQPRKKTSAMVAKPEPSFALAHLEEHLPFDIDAEESHSQLSHTKKRAQGFLMAHPWHSSPEMQPRKKTSAMVTKLEPSSALAHLEEHLPLDIDAEESHSQLSHAQKRAQRFHAIEDVLSKWDQRHQHFLKELSDPQTRSSTGDFESLLQGIGSHDLPGLQKTRIQDTEKFRSLVTKAEKAEEERVKALKNHQSAQFPQLQAYLYGRAGIESHFMDLLNSFAPDWKIAMMEINGKSVVELIMEAIIEANKRRQQSNLSFSTTNKYIRAITSSDVKIPSVEEYIEKEFYEYSSVLLRILAQGGQNYHWDMSGFQLPRMWLSSLLFDEISVIRERTIALRNLELGNVEKADKHFTEATKTQAATYLLRRNLHAMGLSTFDVEKDLRYQKQYDQLKRVQRKFLSISPEAMEVKIRKLTNRRVMLENHFTIQALLDSKEAPTSSQLVWTKHEVENMSSLKNELVDYAVNALKNELQAREEALKGLLLEAQLSFVKSSDMQKEAYASKATWILRKYAPFDLKEEQNYAVLKEAEKDISAREARSIMNGSIKKN